MTLPSEILLKAYALIRQSQLRINALLRTLADPSHLWINLPLSLQLSALARATLQVVRSLQSASLLRMGNLHLLNRTLRQPSTWTWVQTTPSTPSTAPGPEGLDQPTLSQRPPLLQLSALEAISNKLLPPSSLSRLVKTQTGTPQLSRPHSSSLSAEADSQRVAEEWLKAQEEQGTRPVMSHADIRQLHQEFYRQYVIPGNVGPDTLLKLFLNLPASASYSEAKTNIGSKLTINSQPGARQAQPLATAKQGVLHTSSLLLPSIAALAAAGIAWKPVQATPSSEYGSQMEFSGEEPKSSLSPRTISNVQNPTPAQGGKGSESIERVRGSAPQVFRTDKQAATEIGYAAVAEPESARGAVQKDVITPKFGPGGPETGREIDAQEFSAGLVPERTRLSTVEALHRSVRSYQSLGVAQASEQTYLAYQDVWRRQITAIEDSDLHEAALGGPDTETRVQAVSQPSDSHGGFRSRRGFRVWDANRKVFLYPENWIEPELRGDKANPTLEAANPEAELQEWTSGQTKTGKAVPQSSHHRSVVPQLAQENRKLAQAPWPRMLRIPAPLTSARTLSGFAQREKLIPVQLPSEGGAEMKRQELKPPEIIREEDTSSSSAEESSSETDKEAEIREQARRLGRLLAEEARRHLGSD